MLWRKLEYSSDGSLSLRDLEADAEDRWRSLISYNTIHSCLMICRKFIWADHTRSAAGKWANESWPSWTSLLCCTCVEERLVPAEKLHLSSCATLQFLVCLSCFSAHIFSFSVYLLSSTSWAIHSFVSVAWLVTCCSTWELCHVAGQLVSQPRWLLCVWFFCFSSC